jgi:hypothetical protein
MVPNVTAPIVGEKRHCSKEAPMTTPVADIVDEAPAPEVEPVPRRRQLSRKWRNAVLTTHIAASVALLGDSAAFLAIAIRAHGLPADDAQASYEVLGMLSVVFGIPLSFVALFTGVALGLGTRWGVFRYPWVVTKLVLLVSVMAVGGLVLSPAEADALDGRGGSGALIAGATWDVVALTAAVGLSVFKPGRGRRARS